LPSDGGIGRYNGKLHFHPKTNQYPCLDALAIASRFVEVSSQRDDEARLSDVPAG
jgi:hypothetical protein